MTAPRLIDGAVQGNSFCCPGQALSAAVRRLGREAPKSSIHFISGLPRSGPTLLVGLFGALLGEMSARNEFSVFIDDANRQKDARRYVRENSILFRSTSSSP